MLDAITAGQVLGRYELLLPIAQGGMASVWAARLKGSRGFQKMVAIKTMLPGLVDDPEFERMFLDEASLASQVHHPHVIEIHDLGEADRVLYIVMEWIDGEPLSVILKYAASRGGIPLPIAVHMAIQACRGLHAAHELRDDSGSIVGLVHRDVSPQNVLVTYDGVVKVVDFGVAKATNRANSETRAGQLKGKIAYMSPEQLRGDRIDRRTDVFAMGILLYMMTTGRHPFRGDDEPSTIKQISSEDPAILPSTLVANYPLALEQVVMQALAKDPAKRYPTANDIVVALTRAMPPSNDEEVAAFLRALLPDRLEKRKLTIKSALDAADRRELPSAPQQQIHSEGSDAETKLDGLISHNHLTPSTDASLPGALTGQELAGLRSRSPQKGRLARTIVSLSLVGALLAIAAAAFLRASAVNA
ncbi:MAG TPA: serine/threonine-protein kinase, partial [Polyangiaceae bacterium]|nr:serine/threonine-protein kinase [Polyangiaceae bacterium]